MNQIVHARFNPFEAVTVHCDVPRGLTVAEIVAYCPDTPGWFWDDGLVRINGKELSRGAWDVRVPGDNDVITFHARIEGGGGGSAKNVITTVAAVALAVGATLVTAGAAAPLLGAAFTAGTLGTNLLAAGLTLGATFLLSTLSPPPLKTDQQQRREGTQAGIAGNLLRPLDTLPGILGRIRYTPPFIAKPYTYRQSKQTWAVAQYGVANKCDISDILIGRTSIDDLADSVEYQIREGVPEPFDIFDMQTVDEIQPNVQLNNFTLKPRSADALFLLHQTTPDLDVPLPQVFRTRWADWDQIRFRLLLPGGIVKNEDDGPKQSMMPLKVRVRRAGDPDWTLLPILMFADFNRGGAPQEFEIMIKRENMPVLSANDEEDRSEGQDGNLESTVAYYVVAEGQAFEQEAHGSFNARSVIPDLTAAISSGFTITASAQTASNEGWRAFDNSVNYQSGSGWSTPAGTTTGTTLHIDRGTNLEPFSTIAWTGDSDSVTAFPSSILIESSTDNVNWTNRGTHAGYGIFATNWRSPTPISDRYVRFTFSGTLGANFYRFTSIILAGGKAAVLLGPSGTEGPIYRHVTPVANNVICSPDGFQIYLNPTDFLAGHYDVEITRGLAFRTSQLTQTTGAIDGNVNNANFFDYIDNGGGAPADERYQIESSLNQDKFQVLATLNVFQTWKDEDPVAAYDLPLSKILVRARDTRIDSLSAIFHSIVPIWSGGTWSTDAASSNPAALRRHVLLGSDNALALPGEILSEDQHQDFYEFCASEGFEYNGVVDGLSVLQVVQQVDAAGRGVMVFPSGQWGVIYEYDRSAEDPVQVFAPVNTRGLAASIDYAKLPQAIRAEWRDEDDDWNQAETIVYMDGFDASNTERIEAFPYPGFTDGTLLADRALFDLRQLYLRPAKYSFEIGLEGLVAERGDLVGLSHDVVSRYHDFARIREVLTAGGNVTGLRLEGRVNLGVAAGEVDTAMSAVIQLRDRTVRIEPVNETAETDTVTFVTPFANPVDGDGADILLPENVAGFGLVGAETKRMVVFAIEYADLFTRRITLIDEAPGLHA